MEWNVTTVTLQAHYVNAASKTLTLECRAVSELPEEYYPDRHGGLDGSVVRSLKEPHSLLVQGLSPEALEALDAINWEPSELSFMDEQTGIPENFHVARRYTQEPGSAKFAVLG